MAFISAQAGIGNLNSALSGVIAFGSVAIQVETLGESYPATFIAAIVDKIATQEAVSGNTTGKGQIFPTGF